MNYLKIKLIAVLVIFCVQMSHGTNYYVSTTGSDSYTKEQAKNIVTPWKTIQKAADNLVAGDVVYVKGGVYKEQVSPKNSGDASNYIIYTAYPGETVTLDGTGFSDLWSSMFHIHSKSYLIISGFRIINAPGFGINMELASDIKIFENYIHNIKNSGVRTWTCDRITVDGNELDDICNGGDQTNGIQEGISLHETPNSVVSNNVVHGCGMESIDFKVGSSNGKIFGNEVYNSARIGIYIDGFSLAMDNVEVYNNIIRDSKPEPSYAGEDGIRIGAEQGVLMSNIKVYNNLIYNISSSGITLNGFVHEGYPDPVYRNVEIYNNTVYNVGTKTGNTWGGRGIVVEGPSNTNVIIRNNILSKAGDGNISVSSGGIISNNLFDGGTAEGTNAIEGNPLFANVATNDFRIQVNSPAINAGFAEGAPTADYDGVIRVGNPDIGAFEYWDKASNNAPVANAGSAQSVNEATIVTLDASASVDADADPLSYKWMAPTGVFLSSSTGVKPTFTAPAVTADTKFTFSLLVNDGYVNSETAFVQITVIAVKTFSLTYAAGANGKLTGASNQMVKDKTNGTAVTAVPNTGYHFVNWSDASTQNPRTDLNVTENISVTANFAINTFTLTYAAGANGKLNGTLNQTVNYNTKGTAVTAEPNTGYHFVNWSDASTQNPRTDLNVTKNISVTANFEISTGIENKFDNNSIKAYPNPVGDELFISFENNSNMVEYELFNAVNQLVLKGEMQNRTIINTSNLMRGVYLIRIKTGNTYEFMKIIKE